MIAEMVDAWASWDLKPGDPYRANRMEDCAAEVAAVLGITTTDLRDLLGSSRRRGVDWRMALAARMGHT